MPTALERLRMKVVPGAAPAAAPTTTTAPVEPTATAPVTQQPLSAAAPAVTNLFSSPATLPVPAAVTQTAAAPTAAAPAAAQTAAAPAAAQTAAAPTATATTAAALVQQQSTVSPAETGIERAPLPAVERTQLTVEQASMAMLSIFGKPTEYGGVVSASIEAADDAPMIAMKQPFSQVASGNWATMKDKYPQAVYDGMPAGDRPYTAIYLGHRIGAVGWAGEPTPGSNKPPLFKYVVPTMVPNPADPAHPTLNPLLMAFNRATLFVGSRVMFSGKEQRAKFDLIGRLTPELHVHVWRPDTGFIVLVTKGFKSVKYTDENFGKPAMVVGTAYSFKIETEIEINPNGTVEKKNQEWKTYYISVTKDESDKAREYVGSLVQLNQRDPQLVVGEVLGFNEGADFDGLTEDQVAEKLDGYSGILNKSVLE